MPEPKQTLFLRLEGPLQAWGEDSKFVLRRTAEAPTKSGVLGMICCAMGLGRVEARPFLALLNRLVMGVRIDRPGTILSDYQTVGARTGLVTADGELKAGAKGTLVTRRYYLCDASFLVALQADERQDNLLADVAKKLRNPVWPIFLGRKSCPPSQPVLAHLHDRSNPCHSATLKEALESEPWRPRVSLDCPPLDYGLLEWRRTPEEPYAPSEAEVWHDTPVSFDPPVHEPRLVVRQPLTLRLLSDEPIQQPTPPPARPRANYKNTQYQDRRAERLEGDNHLCVFCKAPCEGRGATVQHITYRRAGGDERLDDLRSLCRLCHDAVTMIEYGLGMGMDRINPEDAAWRQRILQKRQEIIQFRSLETRRRRLEPEEVE